MNSMHKFVSLQNKGGANWYVKHLNLLLHFLNRLNKYH
jgi:hypothetical protein